MPLELAELAAGLPFAASFAMAGGISALREGRRRTALNEAMHELRRPLQAIAFLTPGPAGREEAFESSLRLATAAVDRLDCEINGKSAPVPAEVTPVRPLVESAIERWRVPASLEGRGLTLEWEAGDPCASAAAVEIAQLVDNLISNGLVHGSGEVMIAAEQVDGSIRLVVLNRKRAQPDERRRRARGPGACLSGRRQHGHGLRIVRRIAARNGGRFRFGQRGERWEAVLELPLWRGCR